MSFQPLTLLQAKALCKDYQFLIGQRYDKTGHWYEVECVAVAPYDEINQWIFAQYYSDMKSPDKAIEYYDGHFYDVVVLARLKTDKNWCGCKNLNSFLKELNMVV